MAWGGGDKENSLYKTQPRVVAPERESVDHLDKSEREEGSNLHWRERSG